MLAVLRFRTVVPLPEVRNAPNHIARAVPRASFSACQLRRLQPVPRPETPSAPSFLAEVDNLLKGGTRPGLPPHRAVLLGVSSRRPAKNVIAVKLVDNELFVSRCTSRSQVSPLKQYTPSSGDRRKRSTITFARPPAVGDGNDRHRFPEHLPPQHRNCHFHVKLFASLTDRPILRLAIVNSHQLHSVAEKEFEFILPATDAAWPPNLAGY